MMHPGERRLTREIGADASGSASTLTELGREVEKELLKNTRETGKHENKQTKPKQTKQNKQNKSNNQTIKNKPGE
jgi:hypothetical protein